MEQRLLRYLHALEAAGMRSEEQIRQLEADHRQDEANLEKVRRNVLGIFETLTRTDAAAARKEADPAAAFAALHTERIQQFPEPWRKRLSKAEEHGDVVTKTIEEAKIETVARIRAMFLETEEVK